MNKKGQGISMTYIIVAALALVVLVTIILFFTGGLQTLFQSQKETVEGATNQQKEIWRGQCNLYCSLGQTDNFQGKSFEATDGSTYTCDTLGVECEEEVTDGSCNGTPTTGGEECSSAISKEACGLIPGCVWS
ncbi:MAG: hypothetical protein KKA79_09910 [Nanoarchaeota archaeon]|nr:hypothetical protein [Nanoarchaeota archaeon]MCG2718637.1 hypothetical protein [Nanoarchaeota archaeon]